MKELLDPRLFVPHMRIVDRQGRYTTLAQTGIFQSQMEFLEMYTQHQNVLALKARQLGITTVTTLALLHSALFADTEYNTLTVTHEAQAMGRVNSMLRVAHSGLPSALRPRLNPDNMKAIGLTHNGSTFRQLMAGGRSQARSYTYRAVHATEMGLWPHGSSAREGQSVDEEVWSSIQSTLHAGARQIIESTAHGPSGIFHKMCRIAQESDDWGFMFMPWFSDPTYMRPVDEGFELRDDERELADIYGLTLEQVAWRRWKIEDQGYSLRLFKQEYPSNAEEPFLVSEGMWYDSEVLNKIVGMLPKSAFNSKEGWHWFKTPQAGRRYFVGVDPSGGTGRDQGVIQVVDDRLDQVAIYASRWTSPKKLGREAARASSKLGGAPVLIEINNQFGEACYRSAKESGAKLWKDPSTGKPWFTGTWSNRSTKTMLHDFAKDLVDQGFVGFKDALTVQEFLVVREQQNGNIEADPGENDDRCMAMVLALWCGKRFIDRLRQEDIHAKIAERRRRRHEELGLA